MSLNAAVPGAGIASATPEAIYAAMRDQILSGEVAAGAELAQAQVASDFGVSRGPVREAFRLLQQEGLINLEVNHRARVTELSAVEAEYLYALRVVNEALALTVSVPRFSAADLDLLDRLVVEIEAAPHLGFQEWEQRHQAFHAKLLAPAGESLRDLAAGWAEFTERYRRVYVGDSGWALGATEHRLLAQACRIGHTRGAVDLLVTHLSRAGFTLVATIDPRHDPKLLRAAVLQVTGNQ